MNSPYTYSVTMPDDFRFIYACTTCDEQVEIIYTTTWQTNSPEQ